MDKKNKERRRFNGKFKSVILKYPIITSIMVIALISAFLEIPFIELFSLNNYFDLQIASYLTGTISQGIAAVIIIVLISYLGLFNKAGFTSPRKWKQLWLGWPLLVFAIINFNMGENIDISRPGRIILFILLFFSVGLIEEVLFRSFTLTIILKKWGKTKKGIYFSVLAASLLFGAAHIPQLLSGRYTVLASITQMLVTFFFGVTACAVFLRNKSIWPMIILHSIVNIANHIPDLATGAEISFTRDVTMSLSQAGISILVTIPLLIYGLFLLRAIKPEHLFPGDRKIQVLEKF